MKILLIHAQYAPRKAVNSGIFSYSKVMAAELAKKGHGVMFLFPGEKDTLKKYDGFHTTELYVGWRGTRNFFGRIWWKFFPYFHKHFPHTTWRLQWMWAVYTFAKDKSFDIIEAPEFGNSTLLISLFTKIPVVTHLHRGWRVYKIDNHLPFTLDDWFVHFFEMMGVIFSNGVRSPTHFMFARHPFLSRILKQKKTPTKVIPYGISLSPKIARSFSIHLPPQYFFCLGRLEDAKGQEKLIQAFAQLYRLKPKLHVQLLLVGDDVKKPMNGRWQSYRGYLRKVVKKNNLEKKIIFFDKKEMATCFHFFDHCLAVIVYSQGSENQPMVILEAVQRKKVVIASRTGGITETLRKTKNGLLCDPNNIDDLRKKMQKIIEEPALKRKLEMQCEKTMKKFDITYIAQQSLAFYQKVIDQKV